uniref:Uncharacterized protein n=1 Tax=Candidatus Kentrum sp. TC TaxID=2126339 RepID=A0A450YQ75_9GAMM|nr:MAG: hypothetical protein BECKTC1821E_GA0114239_102413 [Candidatus Kentron sp. TC]VFK43652.1 MAG: hypothetical protein BECKTC1821D_GA0114238_101727 [Candidatus Kentron sp. TC]
MKGPGNVSPGGITFQPHRRAKRRVSTKHWGMDGLHLEDDCFQVSGWGYLVVSPGENGAVEEKPVHQASPPYVAERLGKSFDD